MPSRLLGALSLLLLLSCAVTPPADHADESRNVEIVRRLFQQGWAKGDSRAFEVLTAPIVKHRAFHRTENFYRFDPTSHEDFVRLRAEYPDLRIAVERIFGSGEMVAVAWSLTASRDSGVMLVRAQGTMLLRLEGGKIREIWEGTDALGPPLQLGKRMTPEALWDDDPREVVGEDAWEGGQEGVSADEEEASPTAQELAAARADSIEAHAGAPGDPLVVVNAEDCAGLPFDACFDVDGDGIREGFTWSWEQEKDLMQITVHKQAGGIYGTFFSRGVESLGFGPAAWFLRESPQPKALFESRSGGSSGWGLYSLDLPRRRFVPVNREFFFTDGPNFLDLDGDGQREIFLAGRGGVRRGGLGLGVYRWNGEHYVLWWPDWELDKDRWGFPYPVYGQLADVDGDARPEMVAVLDTEEHTAEKSKHDRFDGTRELGIWSLGADGPKLLAKCALPPAGQLWDPALGTITPSAGRTEIELTYGERKMTCRYENGRLICPVEGGR